MANLNRDRDTKRRAGADFSLPVGSGQKIFAGSIVCLDGEGNAAPAEGKAGLKFPCLAQEGADNSAGQAGEASVSAWRGVVGLDYDAGVTRAVLGQTVYLLDDHTVTAGEGALSPAGLLVDLEGGLAWVDLTRA